MMQAGERKSLADLGLSERLEVRAECNLHGTDFSAFGLQGGKLADDRYMVFYNQPRSPEGAIALRPSGEFTFDLRALPPAVDEVYLTATHDELPLSHAGRLSVSFGAHTFEVKPYLKAEKAVMLLRLYRHSGGWRLATVAQGFNGGLAALVQHFGGEVAEEKAVASKPVPVPTVSLKKVTLGKSQQVTLAKSSKVEVALEWTGNGDLDLYAFYILKNGSSGKVYYRDLGSESKPPFITLDGDSKVPGKETITIHRPESLRYVLISAYSAVENGFGAFRSYKPRAIVTDNHGNETILPVLNRNTFSYWVALTHMDFSSPNEYIIKHVETYSRSGVENSPVLHPDGKFEMNKGPVEFKSKPLGL